MDEVGKRQWVGTGEAYYRISGLPKLSRAEICQMFDINEKTAIKMFIENKVAEADMDFSMRELVQNEVKDCSISEMGLKINEADYEIAFTSCGIRLFKSKYLKPLKDMIKDNGMKLSERKTDDGDIIICISIGFFDEAFIRTEQMSSDIIEEIELLSNIIRTCDNDIEINMEEETDFHNEGLEED